MKDIKNNGLNIAGLIGLGELGCSAFGSLLEPLTAGDTTKLAECIPSIQAIQSQTAATLELIASAVEAGEAGEKMRLAESLQLMAALVQFCVNATDVALEANKQTNGVNVWH